MEKPTWEEEFKILFPPQGIIMAAENPAFTLIPSSKGNYEQLIDFIRANFVSKDELEDVLDWCQSDPPSDSIEKTEGFNDAFDDIRARLAKITHEN